MASPPRSLAALAAALLCASAATAACTTDEDCGLLGDCVDSACVCDPGWVGPHCASLDLQPSPVEGGFRQLNSSNWCGTITPDPLNASRYYMYSSDFAGCTLDVWISGSRVLRTVSTTASPLGPYVPVDVAISAEAHNPQLLRTPDGTFVLFDSYGGPGGGCPQTANYSTCKSGPACGERFAGPSTLTVHYASSPLGPFEAYNASITFPCASKNLTPSPVIHQNGSVFVMFHCDPDGTHSVGDLVMVSAPSWRGPYTPVNSRVWARNGLMPWPEDPFLFLRSSPSSGEVSFHAILHNSPRGIHLYSRDGLSFSLAQAVDPRTNVTLPPFVYTENVTQADGSLLVASRRERPWLLFDPVTHAPTVLVTAMQPEHTAVGARDVFTHTAPIGAGAGGGAGGGQ